MHQIANGARETASCPTWVVEDGEFAHPLGDVFVIDQIRTSAQSLCFHVHYALYGKILQAQVHIHDSFLSDYAQEFAREIKRNLLSPHL